MRPRLWASFAILLFSAPLLRAEDKPHWAYQSVVRPALPVVKDADWPRNAIDHFIAAKLEAEGLSPTKAAPDERWLRRVSFDLTGLPPTLEELDAFTADTSADKHERAVDRLLQSPRYGERMATHWLDLARYADTHGYYVDSHRDMWRYRDEVVSAFNRHQPFDQFTVEQLAGDLLPGGTLAQKVASGFNRNHMINFEPGAIPEEYQNEYIVDRVATTSTVWLSQTIQCAQCHDHKHDPFSMSDYYALYAFFDNVPEEGLDGRRGNAVPTIAAPTVSQQAALRALDSRLSLLTTKLTQRAQAATSEQQSWEQALLSGKQKLPGPPLGAVVYLPLDEEDGEQTKDLALAAEDSRYLAKVTGNANWLSGKFNNGLLFDGETSLDAGDVAPFDTTDRFTIAAWVFPTTSDRMTLLARADGDELQRGYEVFVSDGRFHVALRHKGAEETLVVAAKDRLRNNRWQHLALTYDGSGRAGGVQLFIDGRVQRTEVIADRLGGGSIQSAQPLRIGGAAEQTFRGILDEVRLYGRTLTSGEVELLADSNPVMQVVAIASAQRSAAQRAELQAFYLEHHDTTYREFLQQREAVEAQRRNLLTKSPNTMVMAEREQPRETYLLDRGDYRSPVEKVTAGTPAVFPPLPAGAPRNRLTLAKWLVSGRHPLTARVAANRLWQLHFGHGLVRTPEDFGTLGDAPTHPELLDWLADELVRSGWNLQHIQRLIATSATYRQDCVPDTTRRHEDPDNRLLSWFPRQRLTAEMIRDQALAVSGLMCDDMSGPGVYPYQPPGLWEEIGLAGGEFTSQSYTASRGADLYRRSLYTFWKRTSPAPSMTAFDAPDRQLCTVERGVTNTPLQALVLWNDPTYVEASRQLATIVAAQPISDEDRMNQLFLRVLGRKISSPESAALYRLLARQRAVYGKDHAAAERLLGVGESTRDRSIATAELAAWTCVASAVLSLDEALSRN